MSISDVTPYSMALTKARADLDAEVVARAEILAQLDKSEAKIRALRGMVLALEELTGDRPSRPFDVRPTTLRTACLQVVLASREAIDVSRVMVELKSRGFVLNSDEPKASVRTTLHQLAREGEIVSLENGRFHRGS